MAEKIPRGGTGKFIKQGQTAGPYGNDPAVEAKGVAGAPAKELKP